jgi:YfiH family protein
VRLPEPFIGAGDHIAIDLPGAHAVFTTRRGGASTGPYESLNLGVLTDDDRDVVQRNRAMLAGELGVRFAHIRQVHGSAVLTLRSEPERLIEADGHATSVRGLAPMVLTADCLPIVIAGGGAVAVVHAGWRGLAGGVVPEGVEAVRGLGNGDAELVAAIGPGAGPCCYEVGDEVHEAFVAYGESARNGGNLDLKAIARAQLRAAGVPLVHDTELCTICSDATLFFSHRRDRGVTGRQAGVAWLT